jgi:hypothetical protein
MAASLMSFLIKCVIITLATGAVVDRGVQRIAHRLRASVRASALPKLDISVCTDSLCDSLGAAGVLSELRASGLSVDISACGCLGRCSAKVQVCIEDVALGQCELCDGIEETRRALRTYGYAYAEPAEQAP